MNISPGFVLTHLTHNVLEKDQMAQPIWLTRSSGSSTRREIRSLACEPSSTVSIISKKPHLLCHPGFDGQLWVLIQSFRTRGKTHIVLRYWCCIPCLLYGTWAHLMRSQLRGWCPSCYSQSMNYRLAPSFLWVFTIRPRFFVSLPELNGQVFLYHLWLRVACRRHKISDSAKEWILSGNIWASKNSITFLEDEFCKTGWWFL